MGDQGRVTDREGQGCPRQGRGCRKEGPQRPCSEVPEKGVEVMHNDNLCRMEIRGYKEAHVIDCRKPPSLYVYVVMGDTDHAGSVKAVKVGYGSVCPFLKCDWSI